jgi:hypothetical protein
VVVKLPGEFGVSVMLVVTPDGAALEAVSPPVVPVQAPELVGKNPVPRALPKAKKLTSKAMTNPLNVLFFREINILKNLSLNYLI